ncbi:hypothetical protein SOVF_181980 [Spinacia oleracea]|nr:hypothetical protein SOVF_181980 [Spinacia oleracea]
MCELRQHCSKRTRNKQPVNLPPCLHPRTKTQLVAPASFPPPPPSFTFFQMELIQDSAVFAQ